MHTDQARRLITLHDNADRALANLRNAGAMSTDDPRATELLEEAGDAYAESIAKLFDEQVPLRTTTPPLEAPPVTTDALEDNRTVWINEDGFGQGVVVTGVDGVAEGNVAVKLATDAHFRGEDFPTGSTISVPRDCLSLEDPAGAASAPETGEGQRHRATTA